MTIMGVDNNKRLIPSFYDAIFNKPHQVWQPFMEWTENNIDNLIDNPVVNDIPFVSAITNGIKFGLDVRARFLLKKTTLFIEELKSTSVDQEKLDNYRKKVEKNKEYLYRELENVLIYLDKISEPEKAKYLAAVYKAYIYEQISYTEMRDYFSVTDRLFLSDFGEIKRVYPKEGIAVGDNINDSDFRLLSLGIFNDDNRFMNTGFLKGPDMSSFSLRFSRFGEQYAGIIGKIK